MFHVKQFPEQIQTAIERRIRNGKITRTINVTVVKATAENGEVQFHDFYGAIPNKKTIETTFDNIFMGIPYTASMTLETRKYEMSLDEFMAAAHVVTE